MFGEQAAEFLLRARGYKLLAKNYRCPLGEIDRVFAVKDELVFVEVKTRSFSEAAALDSFLPYQQKRVVRSATYFMRARRLEHKQPRFDVVVVYPTNNTWQCRHYPAAFY